MNLLFQSITLIKTALFPLLLILSVTSCQSTPKENLANIENQYSVYKGFKIYSAIFSFAEVPKGVQTIKVNILRTPLSESKEVMQSFHEVDAKLNSKRSYRVISVIEDEVLMVWLIDSTNMEVISTISTTQLVFEKVFTLKEVFQDPKRRIRIVLNNTLEEIQHIHKINKRIPRYN